MIRRGKAALPAPPFLRPVPGKQTRMMSGYDIGAVSDGRKLARQGPVRVLVVDYSIGFGGATKSMGLMLREMKGVQPVVLTSQFPDVRELWYGAWPTRSFRRRVNYRTRWRVKEWAESHALSRLTSPVAVRGFAAVDLAVTLASATHMARLIRRNRIEVLHLANGFGPPEALLAARLANVPVIAHLRGFYQGSDRPVRNPDRYRPSLVIGDSQAVTDSYLQRAADPVRSLTLLEVVDVAAFDRVAHGREDERLKLKLYPDEVAIGIFGRVVRWKGQMEFVEAMIVAMQNNDRLVGVIVGDASDGTKEYFEQVRQRIEEAGLMHRFRLTGYVEEVEPLYSAMDIVVHASIEPEPCGMVVMEAMAARRPVIAANSGGPLELIREGIDGHLLDPTDRDRLSGCIEALAVDPARRAAMGAAGYERARALFDAPIAGERLREVYEELLGAEAGTRMAAPAGS